MMGKTLRTSVRRCRRSGDQRGYYVGVPCPICSLEHTGYRVTSNEDCYMTAPCDIANGTLLKFKFDESVAMQAVRNEVST